MKNVDDAIPSVEELDHIKDIPTDVLIVMGGRIRDEERNLANAKNVMNAEILERLKEAKRDGAEAGDYICTVAKTVRFTKVDLAVARDLGAVREVVDEARLRALYANGTKVKGMTKSEYVIIKHKEGDEA